MQTVLLKIYGNLSPADEKIFNVLKHICKNAIPQESDEPTVSLSENLLRFSFEGIYFPLDDVINIIKLQGNIHQQGKLDVLDIENWIMTRYIFNGQNISHNSVPLNNVLDFSGH